MQGKAAAQRALFATILRSPTRIDDDSPVKWMALDAYAELLLSPRARRRDAQRGARRRDFGARGRARGEGAVDSCDDRRGER